jgi:hypothetical protein
MGGFVYENGVLQFVAAEEGRARPPFQTGTVLYTIILSKTKAMCA